jgi:hypothetical protein
MSETRKLAAILVPDVNSGLALSSIVAMSRAHVGWTARSHGMRRAGVPE